MPSNPKLDDATIRARLTDRPGWTYAHNAISRQFKLPSFPEAITFATRLAFAAEAHDHHPDLLISYKKVTVTWSTHDSGGVTEKDFVGAAETDTIATSASAK